MGLQIVDDGEGDVGYGGGAAGAGAGEVEALGEVVLAGFCWFEG